VNKKAGKFRQLRSIIQDTERGKSQIPDMLFTSPGRHPNVGALPDIGKLVICFRIGTLYRHRSHWKLKVRQF